MSFTKNIQIFIKSVADATGFSKIQENAKELTKKMGVLGAGAKKVAEAFGTMGGIAGGAIQSLLQGGIFGAMAEAVKGVIMLWQKWRDEAKKAEEAAVKAFDREVRKVGELQAAIEKSHAAAVAASDARLKKVKDEIDAVNDLRKAELELERERLRKAGDAKGAADALAGWRKSSRFTPEVEAMVRASAAERAKTTAEDELRKIEANTAGLAEKLDELLAMKEGA